jgi:hypothetical protein
MYDPRLMTTAADGNLFGWLLGNHPNEELFDKLKNIYLDPLPFYSVR